MEKEIIDIYSDCCNAPSNSDSQRCSDCGEICEPIKQEKWT